MQMSELFAKVKQIGDNGKAKPVAEEK